GSSSAFTVGLLHALYAYKGKIVSKEKLAREACEIEIDILGEPIGKQDQYAAAFGGVNYIRFDKDETVQVTPVLVTEDVRNRLESELCLYYTGGERVAKSILGEQKKNMADETALNQLKRMLLLVDEFIKILCEEKIHRVGEILHSGWLYKKELAKGITNGFIDTLYEKALANGAEGGKLLGAGGSGFLLLYSKNHKQLKKKLGNKVLPFEIDKEGTKILFYE
ncbi:MAG: GHMP kinase, partial [bacterium]|nr:GHMP kinase [bacterium]